MLLLPLPLLIAEFLIFYMAVKAWGFFNTVGIYLVPCLLGFLIVSTVGRMAIMTLQTTVLRGKLPASQILHSGAIFLAGLLLMVPSFFTRVVGFALLLPGLRHLLVWRFKLFMAQKIAKGASGFSAGRGGFRFYGFGQGPMNEDFARGFPQERTERDVSATVLDVTPLKVTHEENKEDSKPEE